MDEFLLKQTPFSFSLFTGFHIQYNNFWLLEGIGIRYFRLCFLRCLKPANGSCKEVDLPAGNNNQP